MSNAEKVIAILKAIGFSPKIGNFEDRLKLQKIVYLLQKKGLTTGYHYDLNVRGPYSNELTKEYFQLHRDFDSLNTPCKLSEKEGAWALEFKELFELNSGILEAAATYAYFVLDRHLSALEALKTLKSLKPYLTDTQVALGTNKAKQFVIPPSEKDIAEMKAEFAPLELASAMDLEKNLNEKVGSVAS